MPLSSNGTIKVLEMSIANGWTDALFGKGASRSEISLALIAGLAGCAAAVMNATYGALALAWWQWLLLLLVAFDIVGGIPANSTHAAVRQHHRPGKPFSPAIFAAAHVHPFLISFLMPGFELAGAAVLWMSAFAGVLLVVLSPPTLKRPAALLLVGLGILIQQLWFPAEGWEWFAVAFMLKLVGGHAVPATVDDGAH